MFYEVVLNPQVPQSWDSTVFRSVWRVRSLSCSIDDIEDNSKLRRGNPVAHHIYGVAHAINSANYIYFVALEKTMAMGHPKGVEIFTSK